MLCRSVGVIMIVIVVVGGAGGQPSRGDVHGKAQAGDGDGLSEADRHRAMEPKSEPPTIPGGIIVPQT